MIKTCLHQQSAFYVQRVECFGSCMQAEATRIQSKKKKRKVA